MDPLPPFLGRSVHPPRIFPSHRHAAVCVWNGRGRRNEGKKGTATLPPSVLRFCREGLGRGTHKSRVWQGGEVERLRTGQLGRTIMCEYTPRGWPSDRNPSVCRGARKSISVEFVDQRRKKQLSLAQVLLLLLAMSACIFCVCVCVGGGDS